MSLRTGRKFVLTTKQTIDIHKTEYHEFRRLKYNFKSLDFLFILWDVGYIRRFGEIYTLRFISNFRKLVKRNSSLTTTELETVSPHIYLMNQKEYFHAEITALKRNQFSYTTLEYPFHWWWRPIVGNLDLPFSNTFPIIFSKGM